MNIDLQTVLNIAGVTALTSIYEKFLTIFPAPLHWVVSLIVLVSLVVAFITLIRFHWLFLLLLVVLLPLAFPVLSSIFTGLYDLFVYLVHQVVSGMPKGVTITTK